MQSGKESDITRCAVPKCATLPADRRLKSEVRTFAKLQNHRFLHGNEFVCGKHYIKYRRLMEGRKTSDSGKRMLKEIETSDTFVQEQPPKVHLLLKW
jgi:hypothetical protein